MIRQVIHEFWTVHNLGQSPQIIELADNALVGVGEGLNAFHKHVEIKEPA